MRWFVAFDPFTAMKNDLVAALLGLLAGVGVILGVLYFLRRWKYDAANRGAAWVALTWREKLLGAD